MNPNRDAPSSASTPEHANKPKAYISIEDRSAGQVVLSRRRGPIGVKIEAVNESSVLLSTTSYLPIGVAIKLELSDTKDLPAPTYQITLELEDCDPNLLRALWLRCNAISEGAESSGQATDDDTDWSALVNVPEWAIQLLVDAVLTEDQLNEVLDKSAGTKLPLERALMNSGLVLEEQIVRSKATESGVPFADSMAFEICAENSELLPRELIFRNQVFPLFHLDDRLTLGMIDPLLFGRRGRAQVHGLHNRRP